MCLEFTKSHTIVLVPLVDYGCKAITGSLMRLFSLIHLLMKDFITLEGTHLNVLFLTVLNHQLLFHSNERSYFLTHTVCSLLLKNRNVTFLFQTVNSDNSLTFCFNNCLSLSYQFLESLSRLQYLKLPE